MKKVILLLSVAFLCLLLFFLSLFPFKVEGIRERIEREASRALKTPVEVEQALLYVTPLPHLHLKGISLKSQGTALHLADVTLYPRLWPLLRGKVALKRASARGLRLSLTLGKGAGGRIGPPPVEEFHLKGGEVEIGWLHREERLHFIVRRARFGLRGVEFEGELQGESLEFEPAGVKVGRFRLRGSGTRSSWRLCLEAAVLSPSAELRVEVRRGEGWRLEFEGRGIDVGGVREVILGLWPERAAKVFQIVRGGRLLKLRVSSSGRTLEEALKLKALKIEGSATDGRVVVPVGSLPLEGVEGDFEIEEGVLYARRARARLGSTRAEGGSLKVPLEGKGDLELRASIDADAEDLRVYLPRIVRGRGLRAFLRDLRGSRGRVRGGLHVWGDPSHPRVAVEVGEVDLRLRHTVIPWPLEVRGARGSVTDEGMALKALRVKGPNSSLEVTLRISFPEARIEVREGRGNVDLKDLMALKEVFPLQEGALSGAFKVEELRLAAPLEPFTLEELYVGGEPDLVLSLSPLPAPLKAKGGKVVIKKDGLAFSEVSVEVEGASGKISGEIEGFRPLEGLVLEGDVSLSKELAHWLNDYLNLPLGLRLRAPYRFRGKVSKKGARWGIDASLSFPRGQVVRIKGTGGGEATSLEEVRLKGRGEALLSFAYGRGDLCANFKGEITGVDLGAIFEGDYPREAVVKGDLSLKSSREGRELKGWLEVRELPLLLPSVPPLKVETLKVRGAGMERLMLERGLVKAGNGIIRGKGTVTFRGRWVELALEAQAEDLDLVPWRSLFKGKGRPEGLTFAGRISWRAKSLHLEKFTLRECRGEVVLTGNGSRVELEEGLLCGMAISGAFSSLKGRKDLRLRLAAAEAPLGETLRCLGGKEGLADGVFLLEAELRARGRRDPLRESSEGSLYLFSAEGRIYRLTVLSRLFAVLNVMEILKGRFPDFTGKGFPYDRLEVVGRVRNGRLRIEEGVIESPGLKIFAEGTMDLPTGRLDLVVLVAPLRTVDTLLSHIPLLGEVLTGKSKTFLSFPFKVTGTVSDPKVTPLPPSAIGGGLLGVVKRTLQLPFKVIQPVLP